ncbi:MAG TPA: hypothetical protein VJS90_13210, partial [Pseudomonas sp.]|uniref:hypothetical protein n=1 Tax=Pseudomonas sp. TaxID=306 RepID=UPI002B48F65A
AGSAALQDTASSSRAGEKRIADDMRKLPRKLRTKTGMKARRLVAPRGTHLEEVGERAYGRA